jgi:hypothetical protein
MPSTARPASSVVPDDTDPSPDGLSGAVAEGEAVTSTCGSGQAPSGQLAVGSTTLTSRITWVGARRVRASSEPAAGATSRARTARATTGAVMLRRIDAE